MPLQPGSWARIQQVFEESLELEAGLERDRFLSDSLADAPGLLDEVRAMVRAHHSGEALDIEKRLLAPDLSGEQAGPYLLERLLGRGGMGEVYLASRTGLEFPEQVALKMLLPELRGRSAEGRFMRERRILARLAHPAIVPLLDGGLTAEGRPYLVLQFVDGTPITTYCRENQLGLNARLLLFCLAAQGVDYAHRNLIVHRDLKPSNILVSRDGQVRLLDFGIAKLLEDDNWPDDATRTGLRLMTPQYASPEQIRGDAITTATDVYSLGVLLYELLAGRRPFEGQDVSARILENQPELPSAAAKRAPAHSPAHSFVEPVRLRGDLDTIICKALAKDPALRYSSAARLAEDVQRFLSGQPVLALPPSLSYRAGKFVRRNPLAAAALASSLVLALALAILAPLHFQRVARERDLALREQEKTRRVLGVITGLFTESNPFESPGGGGLTVTQFLERIAPRIVSDTSLDAGSRAELQHALASIYLVRNQYKEAGPLLDSAYQQLRQSRGDDHHLTLTVLHDRARLFLASGNRETAIVLFRESLAREQRVFGPKHERVGAALTDLGSALPPGDERRQVLEKALAVRRAIEPRNPQAIASSLNQLAIDALESGRPALARDYLEESLALMKRMHPEPHPHTLTVLSNLASVESGLGRFSRAAELLREVMAAQTRLLGPDSGAVANTHGNLGTALANQGDYVAAQQAFLRAHSTLLKILGENHVRTANAARNIGRILQLRQQFAESLTWFTRAVKAMSRVEPDSPGLWGMEAQRATVLLRLNRRAEALALLRRAVGRLEILDSTGHGNLADARLLLGFALLDTPADAAPLFRQALESRKSSLPSSHPKIAEAECGRAAASAHGPERSRALASLNQCLPAYAKWGLADPFEVQRLRRIAVSLKPLIPAAPTSP